MKFRLTLCALAALSGLAACSDKKTAEPQLTCNNAAVLPGIQQQFLQNIGDNARRFMQNDSRGFVDADKVIAAATQLEVNLAEPQLTPTGTPDCAAKLSVTVPEAIWQQAQSNSPLLFSQIGLLQSVGRQLKGTSIQLSGNVFSQTIHYAPSNLAAAASASSHAQTGLSGDGVAALSGVLANALLPYGVKDMVMIDGKVYTRADALTLINNPQAQAQPVLSPEAAAASAILNNGGEPANTEAAKPAFSAADLQDARDNNRNANSQMTQVWRNLDDMVRKELQGEQQKWTARKATKCQKEAAKADTTLQAEFLRLQCDTRIVNQRIEYLRGYSIH